MRTANPIITPVLYLEFIDINVYIEGDRPYV